MVKRIVSLLLILLFMCGCSSNKMQTPTLEPIQSAASSEMPTEISSLPLPRLQPNWLYYINNDGLYRIDQNTENVIKISSNSYASETVITKEWVYYIDNDYGYRMDNDNKQELLIDEDCRCLSLNGGWLYYISENGILKIKCDGSGKKQILQGEYNWMVLTDKYIFYTLNVPANNEEYYDDGPPMPLGELHRIDLNGENDINLEVLVTNLNVNENTIYFSDSKDLYLYSLNPETLEKEAVYKEIWIDEICFDGDYAYIETDHKLLRLSLTDETTTQLTGAFGAQFLGIFDTYVYVNLYGGDIDGLYRVKIEIRYTKLRKLKKGQGLQSLLE